MQSWLLLLDFILLLMLQVDMATLILSCETSGEICDYYTQYEPIHLYAQCDPTAADDPQ